MKARPVLTLRSLFSPPRLPLLKGALPALLLLCLVLNPFAVYAQTEPPPDISETIAATEIAALRQTLTTLESFLSLSKTQQEDIHLKQELIDAEDATVEQTVLKRELAQLKEELRTTRKNFREIAAGADISILQNDEEQEFNIKTEIQALLKPAFDEIHEMTAHVRKKTALKEKIAYYEERLPVIEEVIANISRLQAANTSEGLGQELELGLNNWTKQQAFMQSELRAAEVQLAELRASESSLTEASQNYLKSFFKKRGLYLLEALLSIVLVLLLSRYSYTLMKRLIPGFREKHRSFHIRLLELTHRLVSVFLIVLAPMLVFYLVEDWVFFSLGILLLFGFIWILVRGLPVLWRQIHLFLNIGAVREGERIDFDGLPWLVQRINLYCDLINPIANISMRVPIHEMINLKSRAFDSSEPWFPCKKGDWVILADGLRGKVTGISPEMVQLIERGGTRVTYPTQDFLAQTPHNLATNFRIKETIGIAYALQKEATVSIPETLHQYIRQRVQEENLGEQLLNLRVEFEQASNSSLDLVVIADFRGELGDLYNRLRRSVQRWCVDACTEYGWNIPFPQMTLHGKLDTATEQQNG